MVYLLTWILALPSGVLWFVNAEVMVVAQVGAEPTALPWLVALATVLGQFVGYLLLYEFAAQILARWPAVQRAVAKVPVSQVGWGSRGMLLTGGLIGVPPLLGLFALYGSKRIGPRWQLLSCAMPTRFVWYCGWAYAAEWMRATWGVLGHA